MKRYIIKKGEEDKNYWYIFDKKYACRIGFSWVKMTCDRERGII